MNHIADICGFSFFTMWIVGQSGLIYQAAHRSLLGVIKASVIMLMTLWGAWCFGAFLKPGGALIYSAAVGLVAAVCWAAAAKISDLKRTGKLSTEPDARRKI
jgi:hypothetical protein